MPNMTVFMPEPHILLIVVQAVLTGIPAAIAACRAGACPKPAANTQPIKTSSTSLLSRFERKIACFIACAPKSMELQVDKLPNKPPMGVLADPTITIGCHYPLYNLLCTLQHPTYFRCPCTYFI